MQWGADRILALRKHAQMTQAEIAEWLGVTVKQVKYLEHQRRNPSGPTRRLLDILADKIGFDGIPTVQVLGASSPEKTIPKPRASILQPAAAAGDLRVIPIPAPGDQPVYEPPGVEEDISASKSTERGAFVWQ